MSDYTDEQIAAFVEKRVQGILALEALWKKLSDLRGERVSFKKFDDEINKRFQVGDGRSALAFESIVKTSEMLKTAIEIEENKGSNRKLWD